MYVEAVWHVCFSCLMECRRYENCVQISAQLITTICAINHCWPLCFAAISALSSGRTDLFNRSTRHRLNFKLIKKNEELSLWPFIREKYESRWSHDGMRRRDRLVCRRRHLWAECTVRRLHMSLSGRQDRQRLRARIRRRWMHRHVRYVLRWLFQRLLWTHAW